MKESPKNVNFFPPSFLLCLPMSGPWLQKSLGRGCSTQGTLFPPGDTGQCLEMLMVVTTGSGDTVRWVRPGTPLTPALRPSAAPVTKNDPAPNINRTKVEKPCCGTKETKES